MTVVLIELSKGKGECISMVFHQMSRLIIPPFTREKRNSI